MCGITAIIDYAKIEPKVEDIKSMTNLLAHRGPDGEGFYIGGGIALGHRRLAIIDTDPRSNQPMHRSRLHLVFNGMIYNYLEIKEELSTLGATFSTTSDTEVILAAYNQWGLSAFQRFNGMWAIILYDEKEKKIICSRDRFGIKPLYYTRIANRLYFASEIKAFQAIKDWQPKINHTRLMEYLAYNMSDNTEETMFANVYQIPKSHHGVICLQANDMCINRYYDIRKGEQNDGSKFMELFYDAIKLRTKTDVPLATTLSGGMDSSSIVSVMANKMEYKPTTYTLAYPGYKLDESNFALKVNQKYKIASHLTTTTEEYLTQHIDNLVYHQDEPFAGVTVMAQSNIYENINRDDYKVVLGGQGGDEILCGYDKFSLGYFKEKIKKDPLVAIDEIFKFQKTRSFGTKDALLKIVSYEKNKRKSLVDWYILNEEQDNMRFKRNQENNIFEMSYNLLFGLGVSALLRYEDRNSMSFGIESRLPFLDHRLVEYCLHMESGLKLKGGITKDILRKSMKDIVPEDIINRNDKMGFATPQKDWMNNNKNYYIGLASSSLDKMPFINRKKVHALMLKDTNLLWRIINVGLWISKFKITA